MIGLAAAALVLLPQSLPPKPEQWLVPSQYVFVPEADRPVALYVGESVFLGKLDKYGELQIESVNLKNSTSLPEWRKIAINDATAPGEKVYEYRSGRLIKGIIRDDGSFVPDLGSKVVDFNAYEYSRGAIRIYNLPGRFVEKRELRKDK